MSHLSYEDILATWTEYEKRQLNRIHKHQKRVERFELITFLCSTAILLGSAIQNLVQKNEKGSFDKVVAGYVAINTALFGIDVQREKKKNKENRQLMQEKKAFFNQFRI